LFNIDVVYQTMQGFYSDICVRYLLLFLVILRMGVRKAVLSHYTLPQHSQEVLGDF